MEQILISLFEILEFFPTTKWFVKKTLSIQLSSGRIETILKASHVRMISIWTYTSKCGIKKPGLKFDFAKEWVHMHENGLIGLADHRIESRRLNGSFAEYLAHPYD